MPRSHARPSCGPRVAAEVGRLQPAQPGVCRSRRPPAPYFRSGSSISAIGPGCSKACRRRVGQRVDETVPPPRRQLPYPLHELVDQRACHRRRAARRGARSARRGRRRRPPTPPSPYRTDCPRTNPASQSGYQSPPAASASGALAPATASAGASRRRRTRGTAPAHAYEPSATTAHVEEPSIRARRRPQGRRRRRRRARARTPSPRSVVVVDQPLASRGSTRGAASAALQRVRARLSGADPPHVLDRHHPHLAVTDLAGVRGGRSAARTTRSASPSSTRISMRTFGTKSTVYSAPRYTSVWPRWRPKPCTSETVRPWIPSSLIASFTSSSLNGLMIPTISFILLLPSCRTAPAPGAPLAVRPGRASSPPRSAA